MSSGIPSETNYFLPATMTRLRHGLTIVQSMTGSANTRSEVGTNLQFGVWLLTLAANFWLVVARTRLGLSGVFLRLDIGKFAKSLILTLEPSTHSTGYKMPRVIAGL